MGNPDEHKKRVTANLRSDKLVINNHTFTDDNLEALPMCVRTEGQHTLSERTTDSLTLFFTKDSPLSNFHASEFIVKDQVFSSAEQCIAYHKAMLFEEPALAQEILGMDNPSIQKQKARKLTKFDNGTWHDKAPTILHTALMAKFTQNIHLKEALLETGTTVIAEANPRDTMFGIGLSIYNPDATDNSKWQGHNLQGVTLMEVREAIK